jgi:hypothetical protein
MRFFTYPTEVLELFVTKAASIKYSNAFSKNHSPDTNDTTDNNMSAWKKVRRELWWRWSEDVVHTDIVSMKKLSLGRTTIVINDCSMITPNTTHSHTCV